jgi:hypothetical protein
MQCISNQRQIGEAMHFYAKDNDEYIAREGHYYDRRYNTWNPTHASNIPWAFAYRPYLESSQPPSDYYVEMQRPNRGDKFEFVEVYKCPSHPRREHFIQYVNNGIKFGRTGQDDLSPAFRYSEFQRPSQTIYLSEFTDDESASFFQNNYSGAYGVAGDRGVAAWYDLWRGIHIDSPIEHYDN